MLGRAYSSRLVVPVTQLLKEYSHGEVVKILGQALEVSAVESRQNLGEGFVPQDGEIDGRVHSGQGLISPARRCGAMPRVPVIWLLWVSLLREGWKAVP